MKRTPWSGAVSSSTNEDRLSADAGEEAWDILAEQIDRLIAAWESADAPPDLAEFLPAGPLALRRMVLVELIKVDLEQRWMRPGQGRLLEDYRRVFPLLDDADALPADLIYEEYHVRKQAGESIDPREYLRRFPGQRSVLQPLLDLEEPNLTTVLFKPAPGAQKLEVGDEIDDFALLTRLGKGAFATVFLARQRSMQRLVALKVSSDRGEEPQTLAQLDHDHIVRVYDQRRIPDRDLRLLYMQYVPGGTLQEVIRYVAAVPPAERSGRTLLAAIDRLLDARGESPPSYSPLRDKLAAMSWPEVVAWIGARLAEALDYASSRGVLHRDIKPANVLVTAEGSPKLVDFNISYSSKLQGSAPAAYFGGSLAYMSPEQMDASNPQHPRTPESLEATSDIYSLGVLLWELLTTERPFDDHVAKDGWATTLGQMRRRREEGVAAEKVGMLPRGCPRGFDRILLQCLAPDPAARYPSGTALAKDLQLCLYPQARQLLDTSGGGPRAWARRRPILTLVLLILIPNLLAAAFNFDYNRKRIVDDMSPEAQAAFLRIQAVINGIAFPLGIAIIFALMLPISRTLRQMRTGEPDAGVVAAAELSRVRGRCLFLSQHIALLVVTLWLVAGMAYPLSLHLATDEGMGSQVYTHFILSLALCGLFVTAYPFFGITLVCLRSLLPALVRFDWQAAEELPRLRRFGRLMSFYLLLAALLPTLSLAALLLAGNRGAENAAVDGQQDRFALITVLVVGIAGFIAIWRLFRVLQTDLATLALAVQVTAGGDRATQVDAPLGESAWR